MDYAARLCEHGMVIFLFHGVIRRSPYRVRNYTRKHLLQDRFYAVVRRLMRSGTCLAMDQVVTHCDERRPFPPRAFAITFDDGFENNYSIAAPILKDLSATATFYVTTDFIERNTMSWIDRAEHCLEHAGNTTLRLQWDSQPRPCRTVEQRIAILDELRRRVKSDPGIDPDAVVADIRQQCGASMVESSDDPVDRKMNWAQVRELAADDLFTVGGHSHRHAILSFLDARDLHREIDTSLTLLADRAGVPPRHYSYPEGLAHCYNDAVIDALRSHRVRCCPTASGGINDHRTCLFRLKRITVDDR